MEPPHFGRSARDSAEAARYFYAGTTVLKNKLDIRDQAELDRAEAQFVTLALNELPREPINNFEQLKDAHTRAFGDLYDWAGKERTYTTGRGAAPFAVPEFIAPEMEKRFAKIAADERLRSANPKEFAEAAAEHAAEINAVHPFLEGNGRMTRLFIEGHAHAAGFTFSSENIERKDWYDAAAISFNAGDYKPLAALIEAHLTPEREREVAKDVVGRDAQADAELKAALEETKRQMEAGAARNHERKKGGPERER